MWECMSRVTISPQAVHEPESNEYDADYNDEDDADYNDYNDADDADYKFWMSNVVIRPEPGREASKHKSPTTAKKLVW